QTFLWSILWSVKPKPARKLRKISKSKWAREDSNLQPDRYERSALTVELRAHESGTRATQYTAYLHAATAPRPNVSFAQKMGPRESRRNFTRERGTVGYMRNSRLALPLRIFALSSSHSGTVSIHCTPGLLATKGQSTANRMRSIPISMTQHSSAGLEKLPLVVM